MYSHVHVYMYIWMTRHVIFVTKIHLHDKLVEVELQENQDDSEQ